MPFERFLADSAISAASVSSVSSNSARLLAVGTEITENPLAGFEGAVEDDAEEDAAADVEVGSAAALCGRTEIGMGVVWFVLCTFAAVKVGDLGEVIVRL